MKLSIGILESSQRLLEIVHRHRLVSEAIKDELPRVLVIETALILDLAVRCSWLASDGHGGLRLSERGAEILDSSSSQQALRHQIADFLSTTKPAWLGQVPKGRNEAVAVLSSDVRYVLREAGLLDDPPGRDVVDWWDGVAADARAERSGLLTQVGRRGEQLSMSYESARTGHQPQWVAVETNLAGYDLLSRKGPNSSLPLPIEVKASEAGFSSAEFHVTKNEWSVACSGAPYCFHLWSLKGGPRLAVLEPAVVAEHIATDQGAGKWETVAVPMKVFEDRFIDVPAKLAVATTLPA